MAFGKKKPQEEQPIAPEPAANEAPGDAIDSEMFASTGGPAEAEPAVVSEETFAEPAAEAPTAVAPEAAPGGGDPLAGGGPDLLSMFQTTELASDDKAALLELAGEVEFDDLLEDLHTVASALRVRRAS